MVDLKHFLVFHKYEVKKTHTPTSSFWLFHILSIILPFKQTWKRFWYHWRQRVFCYANIVAYQKISRQIKQTNKGYTKFTFVDVPHMCWLGFMPETIVFAYCGIYHVIEIIDWYRRATCSPDKRNYIIDNFIQITLPKCFFVFFFVLNIDVLISLSTFSAFPLYDFWKGWQAISGSYSSNISKLLSSLQATVSFISYYKGGMNGLLFMLNVIVSLGFRIPWPLADTREGLGGMGPWSIQKMFTRFIRSKTFWRKLNSQ